jgi:hypothetical protein
MRIHKGFIVKPGRQGVANKSAGNAQSIKFQTGPAAGWLADQAVEQRLLGGPDIGYLSGFGCAQLHDGIGFICAGCNDAPWPTVFETAPDQTGIVGQQRRCQGVAFIATELATVKDKSKRLAAIDTTTFCQSIYLLHA